MSDEIMLVFGEDGVAREYDDTWDITIHCESEEEQKLVWEKLKNSNQEAKNSTESSLTQKALDTISRQSAIDALDVLCQEHRYRIPGKRETYSQYNEAWQDALDRAEGAIGNLPSAEPEPCEDAVSREAAIDVAENAFSRGLLASPDIRKLPSVQPEPQWIPISERMPEEDHWLGGSGKQFSDNVLISITNREDEDAWSDISQTIDGEWELELPRHCKITAWMPLPEPYRAERRTDDQSK